MIISSSQEFPLSLEPFEIFLCSYIVNFSDIFPILAEQWEHVLNFKQILHLHNI